MDENENIADDAQVLMTGEQLRLMREGVASEAATRAIAQITEQAEAGTLPEALRGILTPATPVVQVGEMRDPYRAYADDTTAAGLGQFMRAYAGADGDMEKTRKQIEAWEKQNETPQGQRTLRAMNETNLAEGGAFVQQQFSGEYIQLLRPKAIVRASGARVIQMPAGNLSMGKITSGASSYWRGEGQSATSSQLGTGSLNLQSKELVTQVPISKKLLKHAALSFDMIVRDDAVQSGSVAEDSAFIRSEGTEYRPTGLRYLVSDDNIIQPDGATLAFVESTRSKARLKLKNANIPMTKPTWLMSYRTEEFLLSMRDGNGNVAFPEMVSGKWGVFPYFASNQIPDDLGTGGDESEIYLYDAFEVFIADDGAVAVDVQDKVSYRDADGNLQSAFDRGETVVQVVQSMDFDTRYKNAVVVINQVTWGA